MRRLSWLNYSKEQDMERYKTVLFMMTCYLIIFSSAFSQTQTSGRFNSLFSDYKAHKEGDILTIYIMEFSSGSNSSSTNTKNENNLSKNYLLKIYEKENNEELKKYIKLKKPYKEKLIYNMDFIL